MHHRLLHTLECFIGTGDQLFTGLHQHLHAHVIGDLVFFDQPAGKVVIRLTGGGKTDLDLLDAELDQQMPQALFLGHVHRLQQGLVAIAQVDTGPDRGLSHLTIGPGTGKASNGFDRLILAMVEVGACHGLALH